MRPVAGRDERKEGESQRLLHEPVRQPIRERMTVFVRLELRLDKAPAQNNVLHISVVMVPEEDPARLKNPRWQLWSKRLCRELRSYLICT